MTLGAIATSFNVIPYPDDIDSGGGADGGGLYLRVTNEGTKNWVFRFMLNGRPRWMGIGSLALYGLQEARGKALDARGGLPTMG
jgi:hypothetical protein